MVWALECRRRSSDHQIKLSNLPSILVSFPDEFRIQINILFMETEVSHARACHWVDETTLAVGPTAQASLRRLLLLHRIICVGTTSPNSS